MYSRKSKRTVLLVLVLALLSMPSAEAQPPDTLWTRTFGTNPDDEGNCVQQTSDGGFIIAGFTGAYGGDLDFLLIKTDSAGNQIWNRTYGSFFYDLAQSVQQTSDGGYIIGGNTHDAPGAGYAMLVKTDANGHQIWTQIYDAGTKCCNAQQTQDGGYMIAGSFYFSEDAHAWLAKTDSVGSLIWQHTYGVSDGNWGQQTSDGGYIITGTISPAPVNDDILLLKMDPSGNLEWIHTYGEPDPDYDNIGFQVQQTQDGGYFIVGITDYVPYPTGGLDPYLVKTDLNGNEEWHTRVVTLTADRVYSGVQTSDGNYVVTGYTWGSSSSDVWLFKLNESGNLIWNVTAGDNQRGEDGFSVQQTTDGGYIVAGRSCFWGDYDVYLVRFESDTTLYPNVDVTLTPIAPPIQIPAAGGSFNYTVVVTNNETTSQTLSAWIMINLPTGSWYGPVLGPVNLTLPAGANISRQRTQNVPGSAPAGQYIYRAYVGTYATVKWDSSSFTFTKLTTGDSPEVGDWLNTGESFESALTGLSIAPEQFELRAYPNPFNPSTAISYDLQAASRVSLRVYDTAGRLVETLVEGWREAGEYRATFDGSGLASGVYLYRLQAGSNVSSGKMLLLK